MIGYQHCKRCETGETTGEIMGKGEQNQVLYPSKFHGSQRDRKDMNIILGAQKIFLEKGFDSASMDDIALEASVSKRTIYNRYASKSDLFGAVAVRACEKIIAFDFDMSSNQPVRDVLLAMARQIMTGFMEPDAVALRRLVTFQARNTPSIGRMYMENALNPIIDALVEYFARLESEGRATFNLPHKDAAWLYLPLITQPMETKVMMMGYDSEDMTSEIERQIYEGVDKFLMLTKISQPN